MFKLIPIILLFACGRDYVNTRSTSLKVDSELTEYFTEFLADAAIRDRQLTIDFKSLKYVNSLEGNTIGICYYNDRIEILRRQVPEIFIKAVVYHELGHCVLKLDHTNQGKFLMAPILDFTETYLLENWSELVDNMFKMKSSFSLKENYEN